MHASRIGTVFGRDLDDMERRIERRTTEVTTLFRKAERHLQKVGASTRRAGGEESVVGANVQRSLAMQLQSLSSDFRQGQRRYLSDVKAQKSGGLVESEARFGINLEDDGTLQNRGGYGDFGSAQQMTVVDDLQAEIQSRDTEISQIAKSIEELGAIFKELAVLVIDQGTILDRIDYNMRQADEVHILPPRHDPDIAFDPRREAPSLNGRTFGVGVSHPKKKAQGNGRQPMPDALPCAIENE